MSIKAKRFRRQSRREVVEPKRNKMSERRQRRLLVISRRQPNWDAA